MRFRSGGQYYSQTESKIGLEREMASNQNPAGKYGPTKSPLSHGAGVDHGMEKAKTLQPKNVNSSEDRQNFEQARRFKKVKKLKAIQRLKAIKK